MDNYIRDRQLGSGAMGTVHLVRQRSDGAKLALKSVAIASPRDRQVALNEIAILRSLTHAHIVRFQDSFIHVESLCIVMELCEGGDLAALITRQRNAGKRLPEIELRSMMAQLTSALGHVHTQKVVHRDIKSSNIFLRAAPHGPTAGSGGGRHHLLLGDFGVAKALESTKAMACTQCGTPYYLPPEVCNGASYNTKADVWSLGVLCYELCALRYPFAGDSLPQLIMRIVGGRYPPLASTLSAELRHMVSSMLQQRPRDRPSADALLSGPALQSSAALLHTADGGDRGGRGGRRGGGSKSPPNARSKSPPERSGGPGTTRSKSPPGAGSKSPPSAAPTSRNRKQPASQADSGRGEHGYERGKKSRKDALPPEARGLKEGPAKPLAPSPYMAASAVGGEHAAAAPPPVPAPAAAPPMPPMPDEVGRRPREGVPDAKELMAEHKSRKASLEQKRASVQQGYEKIYGAPNNAGGSRLAAAKAAQSSSSSSSSSRPETSRQQKSHGKSAPAPGAASVAAEPRDVAAPAPSAAPVVSAGGGFTARAAAHAAARNAASSSNPETPRAAAAAANGDSTSAAAQGRLLAEAILGRPSEGFSSAASTPRKHWAPADTAWREEVGELVREHTVASQGSQGSVPPTEYAPSEAASEGSTRGNLGGAPGSNPGSTLASTTLGSTLESTPCSEGTPREAGGRPAAAPASASAAGDDAERSQWVAAATQWKDDIVGQIRGAASALTDSGGSADERAGAPAADGTPGSSRPTARDDQPEPADLWTTVGAADARDPTSPAREVKAVQREGSAAAGSSPSMKLAPGERLKASRSGSWKDDGLVSERERISRDVPGRAYSSLRKPKSEQKPPLAPVLDAAPSFLSSLDHDGGATNRTIGGGVGPRSGSNAAELTSEPSGAGSAPLTERSLPPSDVPSAPASPRNVELKLEDVQLAMSMGGAELGTLFSRFDKNGDGALDVGEFQSLMAHMMQLGNGAKASEPSAAEPASPPDASAAAAATGGAAGAASAARVPSSPTDGPGGEGEPLGGAPGRAGYTGPEPELCSSGWMNDLLSQPWQPTLEELEASSGPVSLGQVELLEADEPAPSDEPSAAVLRRSRSESNSGTPDRRGIFARSAKEQRSQSDARLSGSGHDPLGETVGSRTVPARSGGLFGGLRKGLRRIFRRKGSKSSLSATGKQSPKQSPTQSPKATTQ